MFDIFRAPLVEKSEKSCEYCPIAHRPKDKLDFGNKNSPIIFVENDAALLIKH